MCWAPPSPRCPCSADRNARNSPRGTAFGETVAYIRSISYRFLEPTMTTTDTERNVTNYPDRTHPGAGYQLLLRLRLPNRRGMHGKITTVLGEHGANILDIDIPERSEERRVGKECR